MQCREIAFHAEYVNAIMFAKNFGGVWQLPGLPVPVCGPGYNGSRGRCIN